MADNTPVKRGRGRPRLTEEQKQANALARKNGELAPPKPHFGCENVEPGDNSRYLMHAMEILNQPPIDRKNPQQVSDRLEWYFYHCASSDIKPTVNGMCNALGIHRDTLHTWKTGEFRQGTHQDIILKAYRLLEALWEDYMLNGKVNPVSGIFIGKSMFGYEEKQELILSPKKTANDFSEEAIAAKYAELPED